MVRRCTPRQNPRVNPRVAARVWPACGPDGVIRPFVVRLPALRVGGSAPLRVVVGWRGLHSGRAGTPRGPDQ
jgi:hypothetical protein